MNLQINVRQLKDDMTSSEHSKQIWGSWKVSGTAVLGYLSSPPPLHTHTHRRW